MKKNLLAKPFVKWAGGKKQLLPEIIKRFPKSYNNYYEPFIGGGAVFFNVQAKNATINDFNYELINTYNVIKKDVNGLISLLKKHESKNSSEYYYKVREWDRNGIIDKMSDVERAARFIYLNKTGFNGLFRVNSKGEINVPYGSYKKPLIVNEDLLISVSSYLNNNNIFIKSGDYYEAVKSAKEGDFVYLDPPYASINDDKKSFVGYTLNGFGYSEQERLRNVFDELTKKGVKAMLSNADVPVIRDLYKNYDETTDIVKAKRMINSKSSGRGSVDEVLIRNYKE